MIAHTLRIAVGIGCDRGTSLQTLQQALNEALVLADAQVSDVAAVASISLKADEIGLLALAELYGWTLIFYTPEQLAAVPVPNPSETVMKYTGSPSVSEAAALLVGGSLMKDAQTFKQALPTLPISALMVEKFKYCGADGRNATVSMARCNNFLFP